MRTTVPSGQSVSSAPGIVIGAYAGFWRRFLAVLVDGIIVSIAANILVAPLGAAFLFRGDAPYHPSASGLQTILFIVYEALMIAYRNGQTIGKRVMGVRVVARGGAPVSVGMAFARSAMKLVSGAVLLLGYLWMLWDPNKQTWHDKVADTYVVRCC